MKVKFRKATVEDCFYFEINMRNADKAEARCLSPKAYGDILLDCLHFSLEAHVAYFEDGQPFAMFGLGKSSALGGAVPWMVATDEIKKCRKYFWKTALQIVDVWLDTYGRLWNVVHQDNTLAVYFLKRLGFTFGAQCMGRGNTVIIEFYKVKGII